MIRRVAGGLLFAALLASGMRPSLLRLLLPPHRPSAGKPVGTVNRRPLRFENDPVPPDVQQFFENVRANTRPGETIGILMAPPFDDFGYSYWRASYSLSGRPLLLPPQFVPWDRPDVVALWDTGWGDSRYDLAWTGPKSAILRHKP